ncbi:hypothetical protein F5884DRAFT_708950 [Xylogone sp. PMI_703]|nr:hypothetical protein F5884DRAFT_708950 [Xylogone sp. PMI_703]
MSSRTTRRPHRKGQYSCDFCRARKLRCSRPLPCTNCVSRGKTCHFGPSSPGQTTCSGTQERPLGAEQQQLPPGQPPLPPSHIAALTVPPQASPHAAPQTTTSQAQLLEELQSLKSLAVELEKRVMQSVHHPPIEDDPGRYVFQSPSSPASLAASSSLPQVQQVVAQLERVSMVQSSRESINVEDLVFKIERIQNIPRAPTHIVQSGKPIRCIWLPPHDEARILLDKYITNVSYIYHVVHHPSLPAIIDNTYQQVEALRPVKSGHIVLLLSIIASITAVWTQHDDVEGGQPLFPSPAHAMAQTPMWIKACITVIHDGQNGSALALETVQGIIILSFVLSNMEGVSLRYRSLISTGLLLSRELGLHRLDHESNATTAHTIQAEVGRRAWWYLIATDWLLAARYGGPSGGVYQAHPRHMTVKKPLNINDIDLVDNEYHIELPISQPTEMSYFLQRIRLAEISRSIVDHNPIAAISSGGPSYSVHLMALDFELDQMIQDIPSFFRLDNYEGNPDSMSTKIFIQAYLLNSVIHTQRCKLHLRYLTSGPNNNPAYASSRETCLKSARQLIRAELQLERAQHPFVLIRLRLSAMLYGVFLASIVLLMDAYINGAGLLEDEIRHGDAAEALRIVDSARSHSWAAANLHESLMQVLAKYRAQQQPTQQALTSTMGVGVPRGTSISVNNNTTQMPIRSSQLFTTPTPRGMDDGITIGPVLDQTPVSNNQSQIWNLTQSLEELVYMDGFQWDDLLWSTHSASFF